MSRKLKDTWISGVRPQSSAINHASLVTAPHYKSSIFLKAYWEAVPKKGSHAFCSSSFFLTAAALSALAASLHSAMLHFRSAATHPTAAIINARLRVSMGCGELFFFIGRLVFYALISCYTDIGMGIGDYRKYFYQEI